MKDTKIFGANHPIIPKPANFLGNSLTFSPPFKGTNSQSAGSGHCLGQLLGGFQPPKIVVKLRKDPPFLASLVFNTKKKKAVEKLPSLKLTVRTWKLMVGILLSFWDTIFSGAMWAFGGVTIWKGSAIEQIGHLLFCPCNDLSKFKKNIGIKLPRDFIELILLLLKTCGLQINVLHTFATPSNASCHLHSGSVLEDGLDMFVLPRS